MSVSRAFVICCTVAVLLIIGATAKAEDGLSIIPYGYLKLDLAYDQARTNNGNYVMWVNDSDENDNEFSMTARQTRLGVNFKYNEFNGVAVSGRIETDFYGGGTENKNIPMLRHAFLLLKFDNYNVLAGQTSDVISPLVPNTVNYTVLWNCGNIGYRHPQLRLTAMLSETIEVVGALSRNIAGDIDNDGNDDGEDSGFPTFQGRLSYVTDRYNVGLSGHYGSMEYVPVTSADDDTYDSYSINVHASIAFTDAFLIKGEAFTGRTLNQYLGGIGQGYSYNQDKAVESGGGWINAVYSLTESCIASVGFGIDQPVKDEDTAFPARNANRCIFANASRAIAENVTLALELSHWTTGYYDQNGDETDTSNFRAHGALIMSF